MSIAATQLDDPCAALADLARRVILARLTSGEASMTELTAPCALSQPVISKHLRVIERAGLISRRRDAQRRLCRLEAGPLRQVAEWRERHRAFWEERFARLDSLRDDVKTAAPSPHR